MADDCAPVSFGRELCRDTLWLTKHRDFVYTIACTEPKKNAADPDVPRDFPAGELFFEIHTTGEFRRWPFDIAGDIARLKVESEEVNAVPNGTGWQLVWLPDGEDAGGVPVAIGKVKVQGG